MKQKIINRFKSSSLGNAIAHFYPYAIVRHWRDANKYLEKADVHTKNRLQRWKIINRMVSVFCRNHFYFDEFLCYGLQDLKKEIDPEWLSDYDRMYYVNKLNALADRAIFANKYTTYLKYREFYKRELCMVYKATDGLDFCSRHKVFIAKSVDGSLGKGVKKVVLGSNENIESCLDKLLSQWGGGAYCLKSVLSSREKWRNFILNPSTRLECR